MKIQLFFLTIVILLGCNTEKKQSKNKVDLQSNTTNAGKPVDFSAGPPTIIYKTKKDYYDKVPVTLSDDKTKIVSYPGVKDVYYNGKLALPVKLNEGFLLDNRGVGKNSAFLSITYEEYSKFTEAPSLSEMMNKIIDKDPFTDIYDCGNRYQYKDIAADLNKFIDGKQLGKFKKVY